MVTGMRPVAKKGGWCIYPGSTHDQLSRSTKAEAVRGARPGRAKPAARVGVDGRVWVLHTGGGCALCAVWWEFARSDRSAR